MHFAQIFLGYLGQAAPGGDVVPLGALDAGAGFVLVILVCSDGDYRHVKVAMKVGDLWFFDEIAK